MDLPDTVCVDLWQEYLSSSRYSGIHRSKNNKAIFCRSDNCTSVTRWLLFITSGLASICFDMRQQYIRLCDKFVLFKICESFATDFQTDELKRNYSHWIQHTIGMRQQMSRCIADPHRGRWCTPLMSLSSTAPRVKEPQLLSTNCSSQPSMVHWLSSPIFPCSSVVRLSRYGDIRPNLHFYFP